MIKMFTYSLGLALLLTQSVRAQVNVPQKVDLVRAAYLYRITKFLYWPSSAFVAPDDPITLCVAEREGSEVFQALEAGTRGRTSQGRRLVVYRLDPSVASAATHCHVLYFDASWDAVSVESAHTFLVGSQWSSFSDGAVMALVVEGGRLAIYIDRSQLRYQSVQVAAPLLEVAKPYDGNAP